MAMKLRMRLIRPRMSFGKYGLDLKPKLSTVRLWTSYVREVLILEQTRDQSANAARKPMTSPLTITSDEISKRLRSYLPHPLTKSAKIQPRNHAHNCED